MMLMMMMMNPSFKILDRRKIFIFFKHQSFVSDWNRAVLCDDLLPHTEAQPCHLHLLTVIDSHHERDNFEDDANADDDYDKRVINPSIAQYYISLLSGM